MVLEHELKSLSIVFSMQDIHKIMGPIILLDGNPMVNVYEMLKTKVVVKEGKVVVDKR